MPATPANWYLHDVDNNVTIRGQFPIEELRKSVGAQIATAQAFGSESVVAQWVGGTEKRITFDATLFATDATKGHSLRETYFDLERLAEKDDRLGRAPICVFGYGVVESVQVFVERIDPRFHRLHSDGTPRLIWCALTLIRYDPFEHEMLDPTRPARSSLEHRVSEAAPTYEAIAALEYRDPLLGDRLRKLNPAMPMAPTVGELISLPPLDVIAVDHVAPSFTALDITQVAAKKNILDMIDLRSSRRLIT
jgi:phage protein U